MSDRLNLLALAAIIAFAIWPAWLPLALLIAVLLALAVDEALGRGWLRCGE